MNVYSINSNIGRRKSWAILLVFFICVFYWYMSVREFGPPELVIFKWENPGDNIQCHTEEDGDALPAAEGTYHPKENSIFFHETSCRGGMNSRQACAVESAARLHPNREVHVLFSGPVKENVLKRSCLAKLRTYSNIKFSRVHISKYAKGTPLEDIINSNRLKDSGWHVEHTSDVIRHLSLYKWGGVYLDTDILVVKPLDDLGGNWMGREDVTVVNNAAIAMSNDKLGRKVIGDVIRELNNTYKPESWSYNGPGLVTRVLSRICNTTKVEKWTAETCEGFPVFGPEYFYPIKYQNFSQYFKAGEVIDTPKAYMHHFWNKLSKDTLVEEDSPYAMMARKYCPEIYDMYGHAFGQ